MRGSQIAGGLFLAVLVVLTVFYFPNRSCSSNFDSGVATEGPAAPAPATRAAAATEAGAPAARPTVTAPGIAFQPPSEWIAEKPSSSFRKAQFRLPRAAGDSEDAELVVFYFEGGGGGVDANINRWVGQFSRPDGSPIQSAADTSTRESNGIPLTLLDVRGTYHRSVGGPMSGQTEPLANFRMLAAVAETSAGPYFFKLTGPEKTVGSWEKEFDNFLETISPGP